MKELAFHKVPLNQMNVTLTCNTFAIQSPIFVAVFCQNRLLWKKKRKLNILPQNRLHLLS